MEIESDDLSQARTYRVIRGSDAIGQVVGSPDSDRDSSWRGSFLPLPAFSSVESLFTRYWDLEELNVKPDKYEAWDAIAAPGIYLEPVDGSHPVGIDYLLIRDDAAWWRTSWM